MIHLAIEIRNLYNYTDWPKGFAVSFVGDDMFTFALFFIRSEKRGKSTYANVAGSGTPVKELMPVFRCWSAGYLDLSDYPLPPLHQHLEAQLFFLCIILFYSSSQEQILQFLNHISLLNNS